MGDSNSDLPAILCLHGYGTNPNILRYQLRNLIPPLSSAFQFIIPDAPVLVDSPGPGATSVDSGPFRRWQSDKNVARVFGIPDDQVLAEELSVRSLLTPLFSSSPPVVGILAFSQGACLGTALCLDDELRQSIKFAVFVCALFPAVELGKGPVDGKVRIPCVHVRGSVDPYGAQGEKLFEKYFEGEEAMRVVRFEGRHEVPSREGDVKRVVEEVLGVWKAVGGKGK